jgi:hypothetical protein
MQKSRKLQLIFSIWVRLKLGDALFEVGDFLLLYPD